MRKVFLLDFPSGIEGLAGGQQFLDLLRSCRVSPVNTRSTPAADLATLISDCEIVGIAGDSQTNITIAQTTAKRRGVVLAFGDGPLNSYCSAHLERDQWQQCDSFNQAVSFRALQQRIGGE